MRTVTGFVGRCPRGLQYLDFSHPPCRSSGLRLLTRTKSPTRCSLQQRQRLVHQTSAASPLFLLTQHPAGSEHCARAAVQQGGSSDSGNPAKSCYDCVQAVREHHQRGKKQQTSTSSSLWLRACIPRCSYQLLFVFCYFFLSNQVVLHSGVQHPSEQPRGPAVLQPPVWDWAAPSHLLCACKPEQSRGALAARWHVLLLTHPRANSPGERCQQKANPALKTKK